VVSSDWLTENLDELAAAASWAYRPGQPSSSEPAALSALALLAHDRDRQAQPALRWLAENQRADGAVPARPDHGAPLWTTSLALLAWQLAHRRDAWLLPDALSRQQQACRALLELRGKPGRHTGELVGHNAALVAWAWVQDTHSWVEPTALAVLALKAQGLRAHPRTREAVRLLLDRQLPSGGCNYGNTFVLDQMLRPQSMPSGMALAALVGESADPRLRRSTQWLQAAWPAATTIPSLAWALMGLAAQNAAPTDGPAALARCYAARDASQRGAYPAALLALATLERSNPLVELPQRGEGTGDA
jgi:hypothetical protein